MCCIISSPGKKFRPTLDTLRQVERTNPHGAGVAWIAKGQVRFLKGLSAEAVHKALSLVNGPAVVHFRWATVGGKSAELCHPFPIAQDSPLDVDGSAGAVLFHNGHWSNWETWASDVGLELVGPVSDSRVIAALFSMMDDNARARLARDVAGRLVVVDAKLGVRRVGLWEDSPVADGCHYSNLNWHRGGHGDPRQVARARPCRPATPPPGMTAADRVESRVPGEADWKLGAIDHRFDGLLLGKSTFSGYADGPDGYRSPAMTRKKLHAFIREVEELGTGWRHVRTTAMAKGRHVAWFHKAKAKAPRRGLSLVEQAELWLDGGVWPD